MKGIIYKTVLVFLLFVLLSTTSCNVIKKYSSNISKQENAEIVVEDSSSDVAAANGNEEFRFPGD